MDDYQKQLHYFSTANDRDSSLGRSALSYTLSRRVDNYCCCFWAVASCDLSIVVGEQVSIGCRLVAVRSQVDVGAAAAKLHLKSIKWRVAPEWRLFSRSGAIWRAESRLKIAASDDDDDVERGHIFKCSRLLTMESGQTTDSAGVRLQIAILCLPPKLDSNLHFKADVATSDWADIAHLQRPLHSAHWWDLKVSCELLDLARLLAAIGLHARGPFVVVVVVVLFSRKVGFSCGGCSLISNSN